MVLATGSARFAIAADESSDGVSPDGHWFACVVGPLRMVLEWPQLVAATGR